MPVRLTHLALALLFAATIHLAARADEAGDQYATAAGHYAASRWQLSADEFEQFLNKFPKHARVLEATFFRAEALVQLGQPAEAETCYDELLERWPDSRFTAQALFRQGEAAYLAGHDQTARAALERFTGEFPKDPRNAYALVYLGETILAAGDARASRELFNQALAAYPKGPLVDECQLGLAKAGESLGSIDDARATYRKMLETSGTTTDEARYRLGLLENRAGQYEEAVTVLAPLVEDAETDARGGAAIDPALVDRAATAQGWALYKLDRFADAERRLAAVIAHDAKNEEAQYCLGLVRAGDARYAAAIEPLEQVIAGGTNASRLAQVRAALAICYAHTERLKEAKTVYTSLVESQPPAELTDAATYWLAEAVLASDPAWAATLFQSLVKDGSDSEFNAKALAGLAWSQLQMADPLSSAASFDRLLKTYPDDPRAPEAALVRGQALEMLDEPDPALSMYDLVIEKYPNSKQFAEALWRAARLEHRLERPRQAETRYRQLSTVLPPVAQYDALLWHWAAALDQLNRREDSGALLEQLRRTCPESPLAPEATCRLAERAFDSKDYFLAGRLAAEVVAIDPPPKALPEALYLQGQLALEQGNWVDVAPPLERLVRQFPDSRLVLAAKYWQAEASYRQHDYAKACEQFARLEDQTAGRDERWLAMIPLRHAQSLGQQGRWGEALEVASGIAKAYPDFAQQYEADYVIGRALAGGAEFAAAREAYGRVIRSETGGKTETAAMAQWMIGETFFHQENYADAVAAYLRVEVLYDWPKWQSGALLQAAKCQELLNQSGQAVHTYERLIQAYPDSEFTAEAKRRLRVAQRNETVPKR